MTILMVLFDFESLFSQLINYGIFQLSKLTAAWEGYIFEFAFMYTVFHVIKKPEFKREI